MSIFKKNEKHKEIYHEPHSHEYNYNSYMIRMHGTWLILTIIVCVILCLLDAIGLINLK